MIGRQQEFLKYLDSRFAGDYLLNEPLSNHTWYKIGGPADVFVYPHHPEDLIGLLQQCRFLDLETYFIGGGANLLVHDDGFRGVMINLGRYFTTIVRHETMLSVGAGVPLQRLVWFCEAEGLGGLEPLSGIPGTVGGALIMNAGTHAGEIGQSVAEVSLLNDTLTPMSMSQDQIAFGYRSAPELQNKPLLGCTLNLYIEETATLRAFRLDQLARRQAKQPIECPSCGSVFKRPPGYYVGRMVQELGLKGLRHGDAMISEKHAGFIVNLGNATAEDVRYLIEKIQEEVRTHFDVTLETEVRCVGF